MSRRYLHEKTIWQRLYWRGLRFLGMERLSWNKQFQAGVWCRYPRNPDTIARITELCRGGKLIEFGCGEGNLPYSLPPGTFSEYLGFDISDVAIQRAIGRARQARMTNCHFEPCNMADWQGSHSASLILIEECLYYLRSPEIEQFLLRCCGSLASNGVILVIVHSATKHARTLNDCRSTCRVVEERMVVGRAYLTLARKGS